MALDDVPQEVIARALVPFLTYQDANALRRTSRELLGAILRAPLVDCITPVARPAAWRRAFPRALAVGLTPAAARDAAIGEALAGVTRVAVVGGVKFDTELAILLLAGKVKQRRRPFLRDEERW